MTLFLPALLVLIGCIEPGGGEVGEPLYSGVPHITDLSWSCSVDEETWSFEVLTDAWTANGNVYLAQTAAYLERHPLSSIEAAADGTSDRLVAEVDIVADWRDAAPGSGSAFACNDTTEATLDFRVVVYVPGTSDEGDCRTWGPDTTVFDTFETVPTCDTPWSPDTKGTG